MQKHNDERNFQLGALCLCNGTKEALVVGLVAARNEFSVISATNIKGDSDRNGPMTSAIMQRERVEGKLCKDFL